MSRTEPSDLPLLCPVPRACQELGVGATYLYSEMAAGRLRYIRLGRRRLIPSEALEDYLAGLRNRSNPREHRMVASPTGLVAPNDVATEGSDRG